MGQADNQEASQEACSAISEPCTWGSEAEALPLPPNPPEPDPVGSPNTELESYHAQSLSKLSVPAAEAVL